MDGANIGWKQSFVQPVRIKIGASRFWRRNRRARMTAAVAVAVIEALEAEGIRLWLAGGWGVDALLGRETHPHGDLDVLVSATAARSVERILRARGYRMVHGDYAIWFRLADWRGRRVEVHPLTYNASGGATTHLEPGMSWTYLPTSFSGTGAIPLVIVSTASPQRRKFERTIHGFIVTPAGSFSPRSNLRSTA